MSHQRRTVDENITLDFFKLDCYGERIKISYSELSQAVGRSRNWLSGLKETCAAQSKPAVVDLPVAMLLANKLECTIQDIKQYTSGFHGKDPEKKSNVEYENQLKATPQNTQKERPCGKISPGRAYIRHSISAAATLI